MAKKIILNPNRQADLLKQLVNDTCSTLPENERSIERVSLEALIWNLFRGDYGPYNFSVEDLKYIIEEKRVSVTKTYFEEVLFLIDKRNQFHEKIANEERKSSGTANALVVELNYLKQLILKLT